MRGTDDENRLAEALKAYRLPDDILPKAPRHPFGRYSLAALGLFVAALRQTPEMRGPMSSAARALKMTDQAKFLTRWIIIEVHVDAKDVSQEMSDRLAALGFELDGFEMFEPRDFDSHYTLKFKANPADRSRTRELLSLAKARAASAQSLFLEFPDVEGYIESEVYTSNSRKVWDAPRVEIVDLTNFPLADGSLGSADCAPEIGKKADIHIKMDSATRAGSLMPELIRHLTGAGFYEVRTWSGNTVLTAQFASGARAAQVYRVLSAFFDHYGGAREMTLEQCYGMWRSENFQTGCLSSVPPVCLA